MKLQVPNCEQSESVWHLKPEATVANTESNAILTMLEQIIFVPKLLSCFYKSLVLLYSFRYTL